MRKTFAVSLKFEDISLSTPEMNSAVPTPCWRRDQAEEYLQKHKLMELFDSMTIHVLYHRPDKPKQFIARLLEEYRLAREGHRPPPCIFDKANLQSMFQVMDPEGKGYINHAMYLNAMKAMGLTDFCQSPRGYDRDKIFVEVFVQQGLEALEKASRLYAEI